MKRKLVRQKKERSPSRLGKSDWRRQLQRGDEITWNDPDGGLRSRTGEILKFEYSGEEFACITFDDGAYLEVFLQELS
jgi:hypothetical protein